MELWRLQGLIGLGVLHAMRAMIGGTFASWMTASIAGILISGDLG